MVLLAAVTSSWAFFSSLRQPSRLVWASCCLAAPADRSAFSCSNRSLVCAMLSSRPRTSAWRPATSAAREDSFPRSSRNCLVSPWALAVMAVSLCCNSSSSRRFSVSAASISSILAFVWSIWDTMPPERSSCPFSSSSIREMLALLFSTFPRSTAICPSSCWWVAESIFTFRRTVSSSPSRVRRASPSWSA